MLLNENSIIYNALLRLFDNGELLSAQQRWELLREVIRSVCAEDLNEIMGRIETKYKLQIKRGNQEANDGYTGLPGEITMDTTNNTMRLHDGTTQGGHTVGSGGGSVVGADVDLSNLSDVGTGRMMDARRFDWDNRVDYTAESRITIPKDGFVYCRGSQRSMDWVESDFETIIMAEFVLSNNYTTVWAPVFTGQCLKNRSTSQYQTLMFVPYIDLSAAQMAA